VIFNSWNATPFPPSDGVDDTAALQAALDTGKTLSLASNGSYTVSEPLRITRSGQQIHLNGATILLTGGTGSFGTAFVQRAIRD